MNNSKNNNKERIENNIDDIESEFYYALGHDIRRNIIKIIGEFGFTSFTKLKNELKVSTGTIYHHLDTLSNLIEQKDDKKYYLTEIGDVAFNSLKNNIKDLEFPENAKENKKIPLLYNILKFLTEIIQSYNKRHIIYLGAINVIILINGIIFCELNAFYSILLFFRQIEGMNFPSLYGLSFVINYLVFLFLTEALSRLFYKKKKNFFVLMLSFPIVLLPMEFYLVIHYIISSLNIIDSTIFYFIDNIVLVFFQAISILFLSYILGEIKELRLENGIIVSFLIHLMGFTILILFISF